jgi:hypothetical protein
VIVCRGLVGGRLGRVVSRRWGFGVRRGERQGEVAQESCKVMQ